MKGKGFEPNRLSMLIDCLSLLAGCRLTVSERRLYKKPIGRKGGIYDELKRCVLQGLTR